MAVCEFLKPWGHEWADWEAEGLRQNEELSCAVKFHLCLFIRSFDEIMHQQLWSYRSWASASKTLVNRKKKRCSFINLLAQHNKYRSVLSLLTNDLLTSKQYNEHFSQWLKASFSKESSSSYEKSFFLI